MRKVIMILMILAAASTALTFSKRPVSISYERVAGMAPFSKPLSGAVIFHSEAEYNSFLMARAVMNKSGGFDFSQHSLLAVWLGKPEKDECIGIESIEEGKDINVKAFSTKCSEDWTAPYIYYKLPKTDKKAVLKLDN